MKSKLYCKILALCIVILFIGSSFTAAFLINSKEKKSDKIMTHNNNVAFQNNKIFNHCIYRSISDQNLSYFKNKNPASLSYILKNIIGELPNQFNVGFSIKNSIRFLSKKKSKSMFMK